MNFFTKLQVFIKRFTPKQLVLVKTSAHVNAKPSALTFRFVVLPQFYKLVYHTARAMQVHNHWANYCVRMDTYVEEAFRLNVKYSLLEISKAINGDGKTSADPLFRVKVVLQPGKHNVPTVSV